MSKPSPRIKVYPAGSVSSEVRYKVGGVWKRETVRNAEVPARVKRITEDLAKLRLPLTDAEIEDYRAAKALLPEGTTMVAAAKAFLGTESTREVKHLPWKEALTRFEKHELDRGIEADTVRERVSHVLSLSTVVNAPHPGHTTPEHVRAYLASFENPRTANHRRSNLAGFFDWYHSEVKITAPNPVRSVKSRKVQASDPVPFTHDQVNTLLSVATHRGNDQAMFAIILGALCGIRTAEVCRLTFEDVFDHLGTPRKEIQLSSRITKTNRRRVVPVHPVAVSLLRQARDMAPGILMATKGPLIRGRIHDHLKAVALEAGVTWIDNGLRKGFVSASTTLYGAATTARWAGHTVEVLESEYRALVTREDALAWFSNQPFTDLLLPTE